MGNTKGSVKGKKNTPGDTGTLRGAIQAAWILVEERGGVISIRVVYRSGVGESSVEDSAGIIRGVECRGGVERRSCTDVGTRPMRQPYVAPRNACLKKKTDYLKA